MDPGRSTSPTGRWSTHGGAIALFFVVAAVYTWPLLSQAAVRLASDPGDSVLNAAILWWNATTLPFSGPWWDPPFFYPATGVAAFTENLVGISVLATPIAWLTGDPILTYNIVFFLSWPLSAAAVYFLTLHLTRRTDAAFVAGLCFGFAPYRLAQLPHLQVLSAYWLPVALVALHKFRDDHRRWWLVVFGVEWVLQSLANGCFMLFGGVLVAAWIAYFCSAAGRRQAIVPILVAWALSSLALTPMVAGYRSIHARYGFARNLADNIRDSAQLGSWWQAPHESWLAGILATGREESSLFPGLTAVVLIALACVWMWRSRGAGVARTTRGPLAFYVAAAVGAALLALGPQVRAGDVVLLDAAPYRAFMWLPGFDGLRVPARFWMIGALCLSVAAGIGYARLVAADGRRRRLALALVAAAVLIESWPRAMPMAEAPARASILDNPDTPAIVLELPMDVAGDPAALFRAVTHRRRTFNGMSGYEPPHYFLLREGIERREPAIFEALTSLGAVDVLVDQTRDPGGRYTRLLGAMAGAVRTRDEGGRIVVRLPARPAAPAGTRIAIAGLRSDAAEHDLAAAIDGQPDTWWVVGPQQKGQSITIDLGGVHDVIRVEQDVGPAFLAYPRELRIDVSVDGLAWDAAWQGSMLAAALAGAMEDPVRNPLRFTFAARRARFVRLQQLGESGAPWRVAELRVFGR
jgi:hypothetical protein